MTLSLVPPPAKPRIALPGPPWTDWFANETSPFGHSGFDTSKDHRRKWTKESPLRFAYVYLSHHLVLQGVQPPTVTFNEVHLGLSRAAKRWTQPKRWREIWVAPRGIGKTSWAFVILPLWALAHGHRSYFMAFSYDAQMAHDQLANIRLELAENELLLNDFHELRASKVRGASNTGKTVVASGGTIAAMGMQGNLLGKKSRSSRPDLIVCDDIEKMEVTMSPDEKLRIVKTLTSGVLQMGTDHTAVGVFGTPTSYGSVIHDAAQHARGRERVEWIESSGFTARVFPGIKVDPDTGQERSVWPERWPLTERHFGQELRLTEDGKIPREFEEGFLLDPSPYGTEAGSFWRETLFKHRTSRSFGGVWEHAMYIDVATTTRAKSDRTAIVVVGWDPARRFAVIEYAQAFRISAEDLRQRALRLAARKPTLKTIVVETNQGGDTWREMLSPRHDPLSKYGIKLYTEHVSVSKRDRVEQALTWYETQRVFHDPTLKGGEMEREMVMFPSPKFNDDLVDGATGALRVAFGK